MPPCHFFGAHAMLRVYDRLLDALAWVAALLILAIMVGVGADVGSRYLFNRPIGWMLEFTEHSLLIILAFGMAWLVRQRGHVAIELVVNTLPPRMAWISNMISVAAAGMTSAVLGFWAAAAAIGDFRRGVETFGIYPIPRFLLFAVIAIGFILTALEFVRWLIELARRTPEPFGAQPREDTRTFGPTA